MLYFVQTAVFFEESSLDELGRMAKFRIIDRQLNNLIVDASVDLSRKIREINTIFIYSAFKLLSKSKISKTDYLDSIYKAIIRVIKASRIGKNEVVKLECYDINNREGYSAKDLEVRFGERLIVDGYKADIIGPERLIYAVLLNGICYVGQEKYAKLGKKVLNPQRYYSQIKHTSRAELKIAEGFNEFGIKGSGIAIDLGAAPGGWSSFLAKSHFKVISVDTAGLDYESLKAAGLKVKVVKSAAGVAKELQRSDIVHLKSKSEEIMGTLKGINADLLANDMNMHCESSSEVVLKYSKLLKKGGILLMTIKCITRNAPKYIRITEKLLFKEFSIKNIKVLPSNRQEVTLFAVKK